MDPPSVIQIDPLPGLGKMLEKIFARSARRQSHNTLSMFHAHKVIAIEPNIYSHVALLNNLELNNICSDKVEPLNIAD